MTEEPAPCTGRLMARKDVVDLDVEGYSPSLFDVEDLTEQPKVRDMTISRVEPSDVEEFSRRYHYTGAKGAALWCWGLWNGPVLHGVIAYNTPTRNAQKSVFGEDHLESVWHMGRLVLSDDSPHNSESRLIGGSLRAIQRDYPHVWGILTYAASDVGHVGYVYQATNAIYTGTSSDSGYFLTPEGIRRGTIGKQGRRVSKAEGAARRWTFHASGPKHRYLYILGNKTQRKQRRKLLRYPVLPYPKKQEDR